MFYNRAPCPPFAVGADDVRLFAFVRFTTGDAMSKRSKFALITWIGENVSGLQRAKTGTDKTLVKEVVQVTVLVFLWGLWAGEGAGHIPQRATIQQGHEGLGWAPWSVTWNVSCYISGPLAPLVRCTPNCFLGW